MDSEDEKEDSQIEIIHSGLTFFPTHRQILTLIFLTILEAQGIYICLPVTKNSNISFLIGQIFLLVIIVYAWYMILSTTPGPMSQLFNQEFLKKAIQDGLKEQHEQDDHKICTKCQIQRAQKFYNCESCNRCVYRHYFHSRWLNTCIAKENFTSFIAFMIFLEIYLVLLGVDNIVFFLQIRGEESFVDFFIANIENAIISCFLFMICFCILAFMSMIVASYICAFRIKPSVEPFGCKQGCQGLKKIGSNDKILDKIRQSIRQSHFLRNEESSNQSSHQELFRETQNFQAKQLDLKSFKKSIMHTKEPSLCSIDDYQGNPYKTDFFSSAKIFKKKLNSIERAKNRQQNDHNVDIEDMTRSKWKRYIKSTFEKDSYVKRNSQLAQSLQRKGTLLTQKQKTIEIRRTDSKQLQPHRDSIMKQNSIIKRKFLSSLSTQEPNRRQSCNTLGIKKLRFVKKHADSSKLTDIFEKQSRLEDN